MLRAACAEAACGSDPAADLAAVVRATRNGPRLLDAITLLSIVDPTFREPVDLFALLRDARAGRTAALDQWLAVVRRWEAAPSEQLSQGLHASALCGDWRYPWGSSATPVAARKRALARSAARLPARRLWPFDRATATGNGFIRQCLDWPPTPPTPTARGKLPNVPTLLIGGTHDLSTPLVWARAELRLAPGGRLVTVAGAGHSVQSRARSDAGRDAVRGFLLD